MAIDVLQYMEKYEVSIDHILDIMFRCGKSYTACE